LKRGVVSSAPSSERGRTKGPNNEERQNKGSHFMLARRRKKGIKLYSYIQVGKTSKKYAGELRSDAKRGRDRERERERQRERDRETVARSIAEERGGSSTKSKPRAIPVAHIRNEAREVSFLCDSRSSFQLARRDRERERERERERRGPTTRKSNRSLCAIDMAQFRPPSSVLFLRFILGGQKPARNLLRGGTYARVIFITSGGKKRSRAVMDDT